MPLISRHGGSIQGSPNADIGTPAASMQAADPFTDDESCYRFAQSMQTSPFVLDQHAEKSIQRNKEPHSESASLAFDVKATASESTGRRTNIEAAVVGVRDAIERLQQAQTILREKLALPQSARELLRAPRELSFDDSIVSDEAACRDPVPILTPSSSAAPSPSEDVTEPAFPVCADEKLAIPQAHVDGDIREEPLLQAACLSGNSERNIVKDAGGMPHVFRRLGGAVKPPVKRPHLPRVDTTNIRPLTMYPAGADTTAAPLSCTTAPTNPLSDRFYDGVPSEVFIRAEWLRASSSDGEGNRSESCWTWEGVEIWIQGIEPLESE